MKIKILYLAMALFVTSAIIGSGDSAAFFTAKFGPLTNFFTAGTVMISSGDAEGKLVVKNDSETWGPGECKEVELTITNTGSKKAYVRARFEGAWQAAFHRNKASVTADYSYEYVEKDGAEPQTFEGTVQSSSNPVYYYYGDFAGSGNIQNPCTFKSSSWFTAKDSPSPLYLSPASLATLSEGGYDLFSATAEYSSDSSEAQPDDSDDIPILLDYINEPAVIELFLDDDNKNLYALDEEDELDSLDNGYEPYSLDIMAVSTMSNGSPTVNGLFYSDGDFERYNLIGTSFLGSKLYSYMDGTTLYVALVVDPGVNDNTFDKGPQSAYMKSAGWPGQGNRPFSQLINSEYAEFTLACGDKSWTWKQGYAGQPDPKSHLYPTWSSSNEAGAGSGDPPGCYPESYESSSSLVWNLNNYAQKYQDLEEPKDPNLIIDAWDVTKQYNTPGDINSWKSPYEDAFPDDVTKVLGYPYYSPQYGWEWAMVYEFSVDLSCCGADTIYLANISSHHSPSKKGPEDDLFPGIAIQKCVSVDSLNLEDSEKEWFCSPEWPELIGNDPAFKFVVTNTGDITLTNIEVTDDVFGSIGTITSLAPGASYTLYYTDSDWATRIFDADNVSIELCDEMNTDDWDIGEDGYFYYTEPLAPGEEVTLCVKVCLDDVSGGIIEGAQFTLYTCVDAVQASNNASTHVWGWEPEP